jgi:Fis family transcriptional regulator
MPAKKNYGTARRAARAAERSIAMRMVSPLSAASRGDSRGGALAAGAGGGALVAGRALAASATDEGAAQSLPEQLPLPLRDHAQRALTDYFANLDGHRPAHLYDLVMREVEEPLFRAVLDHCGGNQSQAATILGINRGTLRKKLRDFGLSS